MNTDDRNIPETLTSGADRLVINSDGIRNALFMKVYHCAVYTESAASDITTIDGAMPFAVRIEVLMDNLPDEMPDRWEKNLVPEVGPEVFRALEHDFATLERGDVLLFTYTPGTGTSAFINGQLVLFHDDAALLKAILDIWVGDDPVSHSLKQDLLG